ncbi:hypothetical protein [Numidum massiliense]|uniref:hypothetical protein n=1 Tax=Numidum massiliense TaxID=1522315 RepID=UPI0006D5376E|nr:hypothetical protein [Numidum massiliense]
MRFILSYLASLLSAVLTLVIPALGNRSFGELLEGLSIYLTFLIPLSFVGCIFGEALFAWKREQVMRITSGVVWYVFLAVAYSFLFVLVFSSSGDSFGNFLSSVMAFSILTTIGALAFYFTRLVFEWEYARR